MKATTIPNPVDAGVSFDSFSRSAGLRSTDDIHFDKDITKEGGDALSAILFTQPEFPACVATENSREKVHHVVQGLEVMKIDCSTECVKAEEYNVRSVPSVLFFRSGRLVADIIRACQTEEQLLGTLSAL